MHLWLIHHYYHQLPIRVKQTVHDNIVFGPFLNKQIFKTWNKTYQEGISRPDLHKPLAFPSEPSSGGVGRHKKASGAVTTSLYLSDRFSTVSRAGGRPSVRKVFKLRNCVKLERYCFGIEWDAIDTKYPM